VAVEIGADIVIPSTNVLSNNEKLQHTMNFGCSTLQSLFLQKRIELPSESKGALGFECNTQ
jgi:hypothetical protein